jgi:hypothetical protein
MQFKQSTIPEMVESEREMVLTAPERYGQHYETAFRSSIFLSQFVKSIDAGLFVFGAFLSQAKKHHLLALFSTVRLHKVQAMMDLRQVLEAGACAAYAIANPNPKDFVDVDQRGLLNPSQKLQGKRYRWLEQNFPAGSEAIKEMKDHINTSTAHANLLNTHNTFRPDDKTKSFAAPFFDFEDEHDVKTDLWLIGKVSIILVDLFHGVNAKLNLVKLVDDFEPAVMRLLAENDARRQELMATDRYKQAMAKNKARKIQSAS